MFSDTNANGFDLHCSSVKCILECLLLAILYVSSLYIWCSKHPSNHPSTINKRFVSVFVMLLFSPLYTWYFIHDKTEVPVWYWFGFKWDGIFISAISSLILTCILFMGPICLQEMHLKTILGAENIKTCFTNAIWLKNSFVAPISEEITFRACIIPLLLQHFEPTTTVFISSVFFGAAHFCQLIDRIQDGTLCLNAFLMTAFQSLYTTVFGMYAAMLFFLTGHIIAPIVAHSFCNLMCFPGFHEMLQVHEPRRSCLFVLSIIGILLWMVAMKYVTSQSIFSNQIEWTEMYHCNITESGK